MMSAHTLHFLKVNLQLVTRNPSVSDRVFLPWTYIGRMVETSFHLCWSRDVSVSPVLHIHDISRGAIHLVKSGFSYFWSGESRYWLYMAVKELAHLRKLAVTWLLKCTDRWYFGGCSIGWLHLKKAEKNTSRWHHLVEIFSWRLKQVKMLVFSHCWCF